MRFSLVLVPLCTLSTLAAPVNPPEDPIAPFFTAGQTDQNTLTNAAAADLGTALSQANKAYKKLVGLIFDEVPDFDDLEKDSFASSPFPFAKRAEKSPYPGHRKYWTFESEKAEGTTCEALCRGKYCACRAKGSDGNSAACVREFFAKYPTAEDAADVWND